MATLVKLFMFILMVYFFYTTYRTIKGFFGSAGTSNDKTIPFNKAELCPSCGQRIRVAKEPGACPKCAVPLGRSPDGKLLIRIN